MAKGRGKEVQPAGGQVAQGDDIEEREQWGSPAEFILSCLGYAVGLGNIWRFPYLCYENGGGAFLIPYAVMLVFVGIPTFFIELATGQYAGSGPMTVWEAAPLFQGVGFGMLIISFIGSIYYNMILAWSLYYMFASWQGTLPWSHCTNKYNTEYCYTKTEARDCEDLSGLWFNLTCFNQTNYPDDSDRELCNTTVLEDKTNVTTCWNETYNTFWESLQNITETKRVSSSEEYFNLEMLDRSEAIEDAGYMKWDITLCLLLAWIICFICLIKGIKSSGKVVYFTATFPYVVILILLIRGALLPGALDGIRFYIIPDWSKLATAKVWADAAGQIFFSLSVGMGGLMTFASYNKFHNNVYRDTLFVSIANCMTSFVSGFAIFSILGYLAHILGKDVASVAKSGSGLAFIAYPEVFTFLEPPQLWSTLFFFMLLTLGLDSQFAGIEAIMTGIVDTFPKLRKYKTWVNLGICIAMFILGLSQCTRSGVYWLELMGYYSSGWSLVLMGLAEGIIFPWVYGADRLIDDIEHMVGFRLWRHWWVCWKFITPLLLIAILIFNMIDFTPLSYGDYVMPPWAQGIGWCMALVSVVVIPVFAVGHIIASYRKPSFDGLSLWGRIRKLCQPTELWGPSYEKARRAREAELKKGLENGGYLERPDQNGESAAYPTKDNQPTMSDTQYDNPAYNHQENGPTRL